MKKSNLATQPHETHESLIKKLNWIKIGQNGLYVDWLCTKALLECQHESEEKRAFKRHLKGINKKYRVLQYETIRIVLKLQSLHQFSKALKPNIKHGL